jgi:hypothetical protein
MLNFIDFSNWPKLMQLSHKPLRIAGLFFPQRNAPTRCRFWRPCGITGGGCCLQGHYGGRPSLGTCRVCRHYAGRPRGWGDVVHSIAQPIANVTNFLLARGGISRPAIGSTACRCAQRRRQWNNL